jgi:titin
VLATGLSVPANAATNTKSLSIYFNSKSATVNTSNLLKLSNIVDDIIAASGKSITVKIVGFTRSKGTTALDRSYLSKRVNNVAAELKDLGLTAIYTKNTNGKVNSTGAEARKVVVTFKWVSGTAIPTPTPTPTPTPIPTILAAPTNLVATPSDRTLSITFNPPTVTTSAENIIRYEYQLNNSLSWINSNTAFLPITIANLTNNTTYTVQVRAVNSAGAGIASQAVTGTPVNTTPSAPSNLSITPAFGQLTVNFTSGFNGGSPITGYEFTLNNGATWSAFTPNIFSSPAVISGLTGGTNYNQIKIRAVNANGKGTESVTLSGTPLVAAPSAPSNLSVTPGDGQLRISFTPAAANGSTILRYEYSLDGGITFEQFSTNYITSPVIISGLTNRALYTSIKIRAVNTIGNGAASANVSGTPSRAAASPTITSVTPGDKVLVVGFTPGNDFGVGILNYEYSVDGGINWRALSPVDGISPITITGLTNGVVYSALRIRAVNNIGSGDRSELFSGTPAAAATAPAAPLVITLLPGNGKIGLTLSTTVSNGGSALLRYEYSLNNGTTWSNLALPVSGNIVEIIDLINGISYSQVRLRSVNSVGTSASTLVPSFMPNP